jgi:lysophospholipase L1-like esterase/chitodextrinase
MSALRFARQWVSQVLLRSLRPGSAGVTATAAPAREPAAPRKPLTFELLESRQMLSGLGLAGYYFAGTDFTAVKIARQDAQPVLARVSGSSSDPLGASGFGLRWTGQVIPIFTESYRFYTRTTGGVRVWVNNQLLINDWAVHPLKDNKGMLTLRANVRYDFRVEFFDTTVNSQVQIDWASAHQARQIIPQNRLVAAARDTTPPPAPKNLKPTYVTDTAIRWQWDPVNDASGSVIYQPYIGSTKLATTTATNAARAGRNPNTTYSLLVRAIDFAGNVSTSAPLLVTTASAYKNASGTGLAGSYFANDDFTDFQLTRTDPTINFQWSGTPLGSDDQPFSARWDGTIVPKYDETYTFRLTSDGALRLFVDGRVLITASDHRSPTDYVASTHLQPGRQYALRIEYQHSEGQAVMKSAWSSLSTAPQTIPATQLFPGFVDASPPQAPDNLRLDGTSGSSASFSWDASADDVGVVRYDVYRNQNFLGSTSGTNFTDSGLAPDSSYDYTVKAIDGAGKSSGMSNTLVAQTQPVIRDAFSAISATGYNGAGGVARSGAAIVSLDNGDWVRYSNVDFGAGANSWRVTLGCPTNGAGGRIELRLDSANGPLIGTHVVQATGSYASYLTQRVAVSGASGVHDLYLVFRAGAGVAEITSFRFSTQRLTRVMFLGDSITASNPNQRSYRYYVWQDLLGAGYGVDFVGSQTNNDYAPAPDLDFDQNHEGHAGYRADEVLAKIDDWAGDARPDVVFIHLGTNDIWQGQSPASTANEIAQIIAALRSENPSVKIALAQILPMAEFPNEVVELNDLLATVAQDDTTAQSPIVLVDLHTGISTSSDLIEGVHPNSNGDVKMADRIFIALESLLS